MSGEPIRLEGYPPLEPIGRWERPHRPTTKDSSASAYGIDYAARYDEDWWDGDRWGPEGEHHLRTIRPLLRPDTKWLDAGCGTGWLLSQFPEVTRAGFDLSPMMLAHAKRANPDALFLREHDLRTDAPEWHDKWDLVTCTGQPWMYLSTMAEVATVVENLAAYTAPTGICLLPMTDLTDLTGLELDANAGGELPPEGLPVVSGAFWSQFEYGAYHEHMIAPSLSAWIDMFASSFREVSVLRWPHIPAFLPVARRILVGRRPRAAGDQGPTNIVEYSIPPVDPGSTARAETARSSVATAPEVADNDAAWASLEAHAAAETQRAEAAEAEVARLRAERRSADPEPSPSGLLDQPLSALVEQYAPWKPRFRRAVRRRVDRLRST